jgi:amidase
MNIVEARIEDIHRWYRSGELTPIGLVDFYLRRVQALDLNTDAGPPFNGVVCVSPAIRREAAAMAGELARHGPITPLHGIPVWVKDNIDVQELPTTGGSLALAAGTAARDAAIVASLRSAGAIVMGKVGMTELAIGTSAYSTISGRIGNAVEPRNPPGGSSNGSAVAVALNFGMLAVGVDDSGSITDPAAVNSCVGLRPRPGLLRREGLLSCSETETTPGPIARTVLDAATMLDAASGATAGAGVADALRAETMRGMRIGVLAEADPVDFMAGLPMSVTTAFERCLATLERDADVTLVRGLRLAGVRWRRQSMYEHYNWQIQSLRQRRTTPRTPRELFSHPMAGPIVRQLGQHPLLRFGPPVRVPNIHAWSYRRTVRHNQRLFAALQRDARVNAIVGITTLSLSRLPTLAQIAHLTVPAGWIEADRQIARYGYVEGSRVPWGISILARTEGEVLRAGHLFEQCLDARVRPPYDRASAAPDFEIPTFNNLKKAIAHRAAASLQLDARGHVYAHPTADEFRQLVREIAGCGSWSD